MITTTCAITYKSCCIANVRDSGSVVTHVVSQLTCHTWCYMPLCDIVTWALEANDPRKLNRLILQRIETSVIKTCETPPIFVFVDCLWDSDLLPSALT